MELSVCQRVARHCHCPGSRSSLAMFTLSHLTLENFSTRDTHCLLCLSTELRAASSELRVASPRTYACLASHLHINSVKNYDWAIKQSAAPLLLVLPPGLLRSGPPQGIVTCVWESHLSGEKFPSSFFFFIFFVGPAETKGNSHFCPLPLPASRVLRLASSWQDTFHLPALLEQTMLTGRRL